MTVWNPMRPLRWLPLLALAACHQAPRPVSPTAFALPDSTVLMDGPTGAPLAAQDLLRRMGSADIVLLGEYHDNATDHAVRGALIRALAGSRPAVVFEQFAWTDAPIAPPVAGDSMTAWLDRHGFDRRGWRWPLHEPVVAAALADGLSLWGSNMSRESLRAVFANGASGAPEPLRAIMAQAPMDSAAQAALDAELLASHCGQLPASMVPGMRAAQEVRDAAMTRALLQASADGPAWLIAGNGHVRRDIAVPRVLGRVAPAKRVLAVGLLELERDGTMPSAEERGRYDVVLVTPPTDRPDPCADFPRR